MSVGFGTMAGGQSARLRRWGCLLIACAGCLAGHAWAGEARAEVPGRAAPHIQLTQEQKEWVSAHPGIRLGLEKEYPPFTYQGPDGQFMGLSVDMLNLVVARTGLNLRTLPAAPLSELLSAARRQEIDLLTSLRPDPDRATYLAFSRPYVAIPAVWVVREGDTPSSLNALPTGRAAVGAGFGVEAFVRERYKQVDWRGVTDDHQALLGLREKRWDAVVLDAASFAHLIQVHAWRDLVSMGQVGYEYQLGFAVRKDWPELVEVLNAGLAAVPPDQRDALLNRWLPPLEPHARPPWGWLSLAVAGLLMLFGMGLWLRKMLVPAQTGS